MYISDFQHKHGHIRDERSGMESYPYPVKQGRHINLNPGHLFVQQPPKKLKKGKGSRGSFKLLR